LKSGCRWCDCPPDDARRRRPTIVSWGGRGVAFGL